MILVIWLIFYLLQNVIDSGVKWVTQLGPMRVKLGVLAEKLHWEILEIFQKFSFFFSLNGKHFLVLSILDSRCWFVSLEIRCLHLPQYIDKCLVIKLLQRKWSLEMKDLIAVPLFFILNTVYLKRDIHKLSNYAFCHLILIIVKNTNVDIINRCSSNTWNSLS